jgi:hypothetical protein
MKIRAGKSAAWYAISRTDDRRGGAVYIAAVKRQGLRVSKNFAVSVYGNEKAALKEARCWRDRVLALLPPMTYQRVRTVVRRNNTSGVPGVYRTVKASGAYWVASSESDKGKKSKSFSVGTHGEEDARQLAIDARHSMLQSVPDKLWLATPASQELSASSRERSLAPPSECALTWSSRTKEDFLDRLRKEGLIGRSPTLPVRRRDYASLGGSVWEALYVTFDGKRIMRRFSVAKYGDKTARRLAEEAHVALEAEFSIPKSDACELKLSERLAEAPDRLLDVALERLGLKNDAALARTLGVSAPTICKVRRRVLPPGPALTVRLLEATQLHIRDLYALMQGLSDCRSVSGNRGKS